MADDESSDSIDTIEQTEVTTTSSWKPPASQDELDKIIAARVSRVQKKYADYESLKEKAARADALDESLASETDKAVRAAREEERKNVLASTTPRLVKAEFRAAAKGVLSKEQLDSLLEDVDLSRFVTDSGDVDEERISKKIAALAPAKDDKKFPDLGGGKRGGNSTVTDMNQLIRRSAGLG